MKKKKAVESCVHGKKRNWWASLPSSFLSNACAPYLHQLKEPMSFGSYPDLRKKSIMHRSKTLHFAGGLLSLLIPLFFNLNGLSLKRGYTLIL